MPAAQLPQGGDAHAYRVVQGPHLTEKAQSLQALGTYVFRVSGKASKIDIRQSIEKLYRVEVASVRTVRVPGKTRRIGRHEGWKSGFKKAVVTLKKGQKIQLS